MKLLVSIFLYFIILFTLKAQNDSIYFVSTNKTLTKYKTSDVDSIVFYSNPVTREYNDTMYVHLKNKLVTILPVDLFDTAFYRPLQNPGQYNALYFTAQSCVGYTMANFNYVIQSTNTITATGVCYSTNPFPTVNDLKVAGTVGNGSKNVTITNLQTDKIYYARVYYNSGSQVTYSEQVRLKTKPKAAPTINTFYFTPQLFGLPTTTGESVSQFCSFWAEINENGTIGSSYKVKPNNRIDSINMQFNTRDLNCNTGNETVTAYASNTFYDLLKGSTSVNPIIKTADNQFIVGTPFYIYNLAGITSDISNVVVECQTSTSAYITFYTSLYNNQLSDNGFILTSFTGSRILYPFTNAVTLNNGRMGILINNLQPNTNYTLGIYGKILGTNSVYLYNSNASFIYTTPSIGATATISNVFSSNYSISAIGSVCTGETILEKGFCYSISTNPTTSNSKQIVTSSDFVFNSTITGLVGGNTYYIRTYVTTPSGTYYSNSRSVVVSFPQPVVATLDATNIAPTSITANGNLISTSGAPSATRGFRYRISTSNTYYGVSAGAGGVGAFSANITGLMYGQTYEITAFANNGSGDVYGTPVLVQLQTVPLPTVVTNPINTATVTYTTVNVGASITNTGGTSITSRGVCYSLTPNPTTSDFYVASASSLLDFSVSLTNLTPGTQYYARAYASNVAGTSYGQEVVFTTVMGTKPAVQYVSSDVQYTRIDITGLITDNGTGSIIERGVCYSTSNPNPTTSNTKVISSNLTATYLTSIYGLNTNTSYYFRLYVTNAVGTSYSDPIQLTTKAYTLATVTTLPPTNIGATSALLNSLITNPNGSSPVTGIYYSTSISVLQNKQYYNAKEVNPGNYASPLQPVTTYYVQAYYRNDVGTSYGEILSFQTLSPPIPVVPSVTTVSSTIYGLLHIRLERTINNTGGANITDAGFVISSTNTNPTIDDTKLLLPINSSYSYYVFNTGLPTTTYYYRAYAINSAGVGYGEVKTFTTPEPPNLIETLFASNINIGIVKFTCRVYYPATVNSYGICYSTSPNPTINSDKTTGVNNVGDISWTVNNIIPGTIYYYRAYYINDQGEAVYGAEYSHLTRQ